MAGGKTFYAKSLFRKYRLAQIHLTFALKFLTLLRGLHRAMMCRAKKRLELALVPIKEGS